MEFNEISNSLKEVSDTYAARFEINRDPDWFVLKIQEEVGELVSAYLKLSKRGRIKNSETVETLQKNLRDEIADVLAMTILFAENQGVDVELAIQEKWFQYLKRDK